MKAFRWLAAIVVTAATAAALMFALNSWSDYQTTLEDGWRAADRKAFVLKEQTERAFEAGRLVGARIRDITAARSLGYFREAGWPELTGFSQAAPLIGSIWIIDAEANLVGNSLSPDPSPANYADREYYTALKAGDEEYVTSLLLGRVDPVWFFSYARAIIVDGEFRGLVVMSMHADYFRRLHRDMSFGPHGVLAVYRSDGALVMRWPLRPDDANASAAAAPLFREHLPQQPAGRFEAINDGGVPLLTVYATAAGAPIVVTAAISRDAVLAPFWSRFYRDLTLFVIAAALIGGLTLAARAALRREHDMADQERRGRLELATILSERDQLMASLGQSEQRLRFALEAGGMTVWDWDVRARTVFLDSRASALFRYQPERASISETEAFDQIVAEDLPAVQDAIADALRGERPYRAEFRHIRPDGAIAWFAGCGEVVRNEDGQPVRMLGLNYDITERKRIEQDLRESEERLRLAQEAGGIGSWDWDFSTDTVIWSESQFRVLGLHPAEVKPSYAAFFRAVHPDDRGPLHAKVQAALRGGNGLDAEFRIVDVPGGGIRWLQCRGEVKIDCGGKPTRMVGVIRDVTSRRRAVDALEQLTAELEARVAERTAQLVQAQKMETLGQITGGLAHDFNNLLAAVLGNLELLRKRLDANRDNAALKLLDGAAEGAERGAKLTQRLLTFARRQDLHPGVVDIAVVITGMESLLRRSLGPSIRIEMDLPSELWPVCVDVNQFEMALLNLAVNARDAMPVGGLLTLAANNEVVGPAHPAALAAGSYVRLMVSDTGIGMDEETLDRATEPFFTTKPQGQGTGLGLSMVHGLAGQSGGAVRLSSEPGIGTRVELWLPKAQSAPSAQTLPPKGAMAPPQSRTVLLVDDDWLVASSTEAMLKDLGHEVIAVSSAARALEVLQSGRPVDLVITDHAMPGMTGLELIGRIREIWPRLPVLLASGYTEIPGALEQGLPRLSKPYRQADLAAWVEQLAGSTGGQDDAAKVVLLRPH